MDSQMMFLQAVSASMAGKAVDWAQAPDNAQWSNLMLLSQMHHVLPMLLEAVLPSPAAQTIDESLLAACRRDVIVQVSTQSRRTAMLLQLLEQLNQRHIPVLVVKGIVCRNLYPLPDHRVSGDEDLLCHPDYFVACHQALLELGYAVSGNAEAYEVGYHHPNGLYIELHRSLFAPDSQFEKCNYFFENAFDAPYTVTIDGVPVTTLAPTDHLLYLLTHAFKHFLHSGFGIRQICDMVLLAQSQGEDIDWDRLYANCTQLRAENFAVAIFRIGQKHLGFDPVSAGMSKPWLQTEVDETPLLSDILSAGVYGTASPDRTRSAHITLEAAENGSKKANGRKLAIRSIFPPVGLLTSRYPYLKSKPWLLPAAWIARLYRYAVAAMRGQAAPVHTLETGNRRVQLLQQYDIID